MVTNIAALEAVREGPDGMLAGLGPGKVYIDMSTVEPGASRALAERCPRRGARCSTRRSPAASITLEQGKLSIMVGGDADDVRARQADPARRSGRRSRTSATTAWRCSMKIAINLSLARADARVLARACCWRRRAASRARSPSRCCTNSVDRVADGASTAARSCSNMPEEAWFDVQHDAEGHAARARRWAASSTCRCRPRRSPTRC